MKNACSAAAKYFLRAGATVKHVYVDQKSEHVTSIILTSKDCD